MLKSDSVLAYVRRWLYKCRLYPTDPDMPRPGRLWGRPSRVPQRSRTAALTMLRECFSPQDYEAIQEDSYLGHIHHMWYSRCSVVFINKFVWILIYLQKDHAILRAQCK